MIGDGWDGDGGERPGPRVPDGRRHVAVVTGSRAEFGLLRPVMHAVAARPEMQLMVVAAGSHLILPSLTFRDVKAEFAVADSVPMQLAGRSGRVEDAHAVARGIARFTRSFVALAPDWVVVLGDRIEAFAAASAASIGGWALAHIHGGDRAEGIADEAMRHAISKLAHVHLAATEASAERLRRMGERPEHVHVIGSPAIDDLAGFPEVSDERAREWGDPDTLVLMHPVGRTAEAEEAGMHALLAACRGLGRTPLVLHPNHDAGRTGILRAIQGSGLRAVEHLPRPQFVGVLKRLARRGGVMLGNSSAGLIEAAALGLPVVDLGTRQSGRERAANAVHVTNEFEEDIGRGITSALGHGRPAVPEHPYGDGRAGLRAADILSRTDPRDARLLRKHNTY